MALTKAVIDAFGAMKEDPRLVGVAKSDLNGVASLFRNQLSVSDMGYLYEQLFSEYLSKKVVVQSDVLERLMGEHQSAKQKMEAYRRSVSHVELSLRFLVEQREALLGERKSLVQEVAELRQGNKVLAGTLSDLKKRRLHLETELEGCLVGSTLYNALTGGEGSISSSDVAA
jgi:hypothetical protein